MSEDKGELPQNISADLKSQGEITFRGLAKATYETAKLYRGDPNKINPIGIVNLIGMKAAFPEKFSNEQLNNNPDLKFFTCFTWLGVEMNDAVDIIPQAREEGKQEVIENIFRWWKAAIRETRAETDITPEESKEKKQLMENYQREILFCEKMARETPKNDWDLNKLVRYREVINAISVVHNAAALLGTGSLASRLKTINKENLSWEAIENKYSWMVDGQPENKIERRLCALFNLVMALQVMDDWFDLEDDKRLSLHTIATQLVAETNNQDEAKNRIQELTDEYLKRAKTYGITRMAGIGTKEFFNFLKRMARKFPHKAGRRERLLNGGELILREKIT